MDTITVALDRVASSLESKGFFKEAEEIDAVSNTIDQDPQGPWNVDNTEYINRGSKRGYTGGHSLTDKNHVPIISWDYLPMSLGQVNKALNLQVNHASEGAVHKAMVDYANKNNLQAKPESPADKNSRDAEIKEFLNNYIQKAVLKAGIKNPDIQVTIEKYTGKDYPGYDDQIKSTVDLRNVDYDVVRKLEQVLEADGVHLDDESYDAGKERGINPYDILRKKSWL